MAVKTNMDFNGEALKIKLKKAGITATSLDTKLGLPYKTITNAISRNCINRAYLKLICAVENWDEAEFTQPAKPTPEREIVTDPAIQSINKTLFEMTVVLRSIKDTLVRIEGLTSNCNVSGFEIKKAVTEIVKELGQ